MKTQNIFIYALVTLTGMTMAAFAAYFVLTVFVYPTQQASPNIQAPVSEETEPSSAEIVE